MDERAAIQVIIDSSVDLDGRFADRVRVVPLIVIFGNEEYRDGIDLNRSDFYRKLEAGTELPKTSQASPAAFEQVYAEIREQGQQGIVITVASKFSGTYQCASMAAEDYPEIRVVDSTSVTTGAGILAEYALRCIDDGKTFEEVVSELERMKKRIRFMALLDTMEYLMRGGRVSRTTSIVGGVLNIKPVITVEDGLIKVLGKARGSKKGNNFLVKEIKKCGVDYDLPILLGYTGVSDELLQDYIRDSTSLWEGHVDVLDRAQVCSVIGTHAGPGAIAVAFFKELTEEEDA